jgi:hypothetical protein
MRLAIRERWSKRELERQFKTALFERAVLTVFARCRCLPVGCRILFSLDGFLRLTQYGDEGVEVGWVDVADGDDLEVWGGGGAEGEA